MTRWFINSRKLWPPLPSPVRSAGSRLRLLLWRELTFARRLPSSEKCQERTSSDAGSGLRYRCSASRRPSQAAFAAALHYVMWERSTMLCGNAARSPISLAHGRRPRARSCGRVRRVHGARAAPYFLARQGFQAGGKIVEAPSCGAGSLRSLGVSIEAGGANGNQRAAFGF
jgi:hypothetical protein